MRSSWAAAAANWLRSRASFSARTTNSKTNEAANAATEPIPTKRTRNARATASESPAACASMSRLGSTVSPQPGATAAPRKSSGCSSATMSPAFVASHLVSVGRSMTNPCVSVPSGVCTWRVATSAGTPANGSVRHSSGEIVIVTGAGVLTAAGDAVRVAGSGSASGAFRRGACDEYTAFGFVFWA